MKVSLPNSYHFSLSPLSPSIKSIAHQTIITLASIGNTNLCNFIRRKLNLYLNKMFTHLIAKYVY